MSPPSFFLFFPPPKSFYFEMFSRCAGITMRLSDRFASREPRTLTYLSSLPIWICIFFFFFNGYPRRHSAGLFDTKFLAFTSPTCRFVLYARRRLPPSSLCWYPDRAAASVEQEMKVFPPPPNLWLWPFYHTHRAEVPATAAPLFYNELILRDRIAPYLGGEGRSRRPSSSSRAASSCLLTSYCCSPDALRGPRSVVLSLQGRRW